MKIVFVASIIRNSLCIIYVFLLFFQKLLFTENYFLIDAINLATRGPLYTCLVHLFSIVKMIFLQMRYKRHTLSLGMIQFPIDMYNHAHIMSIPHRFLNRSFIFLWLWNEQISNCSQNLF